MISERYRKALVTVYMGLRDEEDIRKNGLYRFTKKEKRALVSFATKLFSKNRKLLLLKIKPTGFRSEHIDINNEKDFQETINNLDAIFDKKNEIWVVESSSKECWRCRIYLNSSTFEKDRIEMAYSFDDHILDHIGNNKKDVPYILFEKNINLKVIETNLSRQKQEEVGKIVQDIYGHFADEFRKIKEDMELLQTNAISLDVRVDNGYDFHDFDVGYNDVKKVIDFYVPIK